MCIPKAANVPSRDEVEQTRAVLIQNLVKKCMSCPPFLSQGIRVGLTELPGGSHTAFGQ